MKISDLAALREQAERHRREAERLSGESSRVREDRRLISAGGLRVRLIGLHDIDTDGGTPRDEAFRRAWDAHAHDILRSVEMDLNAQARREQAAARIVQAQLDRLLAAAGEVNGPSDEEPEPAGRVCEGCGE